MRVTRALGESPRARQCWPSPAATVLLGRSPLRRQVQRVNPSWASCGPEVRSSSPGLSTGSWKPKGSWPGFAGGQERGSRSCRQPTVPSAGSAGLGGCWEVPGHAGLRGKSWMRSFLAATAGTRPKTPHLIPLQRPGQQEPQLEPSAAGEGGSRCPRCQGSRAGVPGHRPLLCSPGRPWQSQHPWPPGLSKLCSGAQPPQRRPLDMVASLHSARASAPWVVPLLCPAAGMETGHPTGRQSHHLPTELVQAAAEPLCVRRPLGDVRPASPRLARRCSCTAPGFPRPLPHGTAGSGMVGTASAVALPPPPGASAAGSDSGASQLACVFLEQIARSCFCCKASKFKSEDLSGAFRTAAVRSSPAAAWGLPCRSPALSPSPSPPAIPLERL